MKLLTRLAAATPRHALEDALGLAGLCLLIGLGFAATGLA